MRGTESKISKTRKILITVNGILITGLAVGLIYKNETRESTRIMPTVSTTSKMMSIITTTTTTSTTSQSTTSSSTLTTTSSTTSTISSCEDPCSGIENCFTLVDGCSIAPTRNNLVGTVPAALSYTVSAEIRCAHNTETSNWDSTLRLTGTNGDWEKAGDRIFFVTRGPKQGHKNSLYLVVNDASGRHHQRIKEYKCRNEMWNTYSVDVRLVEGTNSTLKYVASIDGGSSFEGSYDASGAITSGDLKAYVSDNFYDSTSEFLVRNFVYKIIE